MDGSYVCWPEFRDRIRNQNPNQLRDGTPILARPRHHAVP
jgi:hypothetical protein